MRNKIFRKITILIPVFFLCLGLDNCKSPEAPEEPKPNYEHRYNVEVIYTRIAVDYPERQDYVSLYYVLEDPSLQDEQPPNLWDSGTMEMNEIGENKYRCYLSRVFVQTQHYPDKHLVYVQDTRRNSRAKTAENIDVQGAYELEIENFDTGAWITSHLYFKMSKE